MDWIEVSRRIRRQGQWSEAEPFRDQYMREARQSGMTLDDARQWSYAKLDEQFPAQEPPPDERADDNQASKRPQDADNQTEKEREAGGGANLTDSADATDTQAPESSARAQGESAAVSGLGEIPEDWPQLASNATLSAEIQWVQANRLSVVRETRDGVTVDLSRAMTPAPSWAALGWLETSIRAYAKFVDVAAKASATLEDEREMVKRERLAIDEIRSLLAEMQAE